MSRTRKYHLYYLLLLAVAVASTFAVRGCQRTVPLEECSDLYRRYADNPHVEVAFIRDFPINDTLSLDVTTLTARDSIGWECFVQYFNIFPLPDYLQKKVAAGEDKKGLRLAPKYNMSLYTDTVDLTQNNVLVYSFLKHSVGVYHTCTVAEIQAVLERYYDSE